MSTKSSARTGWRRPWPLVKDLPARQIVEAINREGSTISLNGAPPADDITLVIAKRLAS